ncbi:hypothetical protein DRO38_05475 [Candidatus Bathyarchaeota archaeon]|nr:MAG: hypothetical protein DRO38_05475 [Candidatus Bathyarchaeota archaeon]
MRMGMREVVEDYREMLRKVDELYVENPTDEVKKMNDDLVLSLRTAVKERNRILGKGEKEVEKELEASLNTVRKRYEEMMRSGSLGLMRRLESVKELLSGKMEVIKNKKEDVRSKRMPLEAKAKALIKEGRVEDAEIYVPEITALEENEKLLGGFVNVLSKVVGRLSGLITKIDVLNTLRSINISKLDFEEVRNLRGKVESVAGDINELQNELGSVLSMSESGILSGTMNEGEKKTLKRLVAEAGDVSEEAKRYMEKMKEVEERYKEMKG